ncbi:precorrin-3B synthase [Pseudomonas sp. CFBP 13711]|uniref:precorrin-3B synthase n=1 Tax=unclassified Pseudomonas TaxID=196821 RepID=UPI0017844E75|nr:MULTISPECIES: precorrin-3B synthase [unclassified Pseudomonas]MBD8708119.1 precorrin-3B synthase [Pseudomonas sp. CFBP 13711]MBD8713641.1 precorrin-3B synthase [Pseudomonas sp. CFBP 13715]
MTEPLSARPSATPIRPSACPGLLRIVPALDGGICRIKLPGGVLSAEQAMVVASAAEGFASGVIEATNRGNLQIRGIGADHDGLIASLLDAGLGPSNPASDDVRNLMLSPTAGIDPQQLLDVRPLAGQILHSLEHHPRFHELSPKFALSLDGGEGLAMLEHPHDLWLSPLQVDGQTLLGFGFAGCPATDSPVAAVAPDAAHALVVAVLETFLNLARPEHARMRDLLKEVPVARFIEHVAARSPQRLVIDHKVTDWRRAPTRSFAHIGTYAQATAGIMAVGAGVPLGRLRPSMLREAARLAIAFGDGQLCMTPWQSLMLRNVPAGHSVTVMEGLSQAGLLVDAAQSLSKIVACTGSAACAKGLADTKADALHLAALLQENAISRAVHLSGCARSCAAAHVMPVTLLAASPGRYDLYFRHAEMSGFGDLHARDLTIEAVGALLTADSRSNTDD